jgi:hypothetical protein
MPGSAPDYSVRPVWWQCSGSSSLIAAAIAALSLALPVWAAALIVAVVLFAVAGIAALVSKKQLDQASPTPEMTVANVKQDIHELKVACV